jgi:3-oxoacyl-[acyl-carrier protein] reductase
MSAWSAHSANVDNAIFVFHLSFELEKEKHAMATADGRLSGKVAIITGASTGCGPVMAKLFVQEGARVLLAARREELVLQAAREAGKGAVGMRADVTREEDVAAMADRAMKEFGQIDIMLNNAAAPGTDKYVWEQTLENWNATIAIDLTAAMLCTREVLKRSMLERKSGSIINFSSTAGWSGIPRKTHYCSAKAALRAFTKTVALEVGPYGIRCNCLVPGGIDTELWRNYGRRMAGEQGIDYETWRTRSLQAVPLRTISQPDDIANLALFLASDESRTITGQSINCDAGAYMVG